MDAVTEALSVDTPNFRLSFRPFVSYLNAQRTKASSVPLYEFYSHVIDQFVDTLSLDDAAQALSQVRLAELFQVATAIVLPISETNQSTPFAFGLPVPLTILHQSTGFSQLLGQFPDLLLRLPEQISLVDRQRIMYRLVLEKCYGVAFANQADPAFRFQQDLDGLSRYYRMDVNLTFVDARFATPLPPLQRAWIDFANGIDQVLPTYKALPINGFLFEGFALFRVHNITESETVQRLQEVFTHLQSDTETVVYQRFQTALRNLCGQPDLVVSLLPLPQINGQLVPHPVLKKESIFLQHAVGSLDNFNRIIDRQKARNRLVQLTPQLFPSLNGLPKPEWEVLSRQNIHSFLLYPITVAGEVLGILEMGSPHADALDETVLLKIDRILPLIQELLRYQLQQFNAKLERLIKTNFTSLQPAVEWKFYEAAWEDLRIGRAVRTGNSTPVRFPEVYPLYGAVDIRNSSVERHQAIQQDLTEQLSAVEDVLHHLPLLNECRHWQHILTEQIKSDDEQAVSRFLEQDVHPYLRQRLANQDSSEALIQAYFERVDPLTGQFTQALKQYERSMDWLNAVVNEHIDQEEKALQAIYPHYFERYRSDGTEYTLYVGQSIAPANPFKPAIRQRLCEWQLSAMVEIARLTNLLCPRLPIPLRTTQLILAHAQPVDISFRHDERRFDVEGSYSIRYEVLKKRIDKARISPTKERLTQPDTIAIVYNYKAELQDYLPFIAQLQQQGLLAPGIDYFDLEPLQGVRNLKAVRVGILYSD